MKKFILLSVILLASACSSGPTRPPQEQAIFHALAQDATLRQIADYCGDISTTLENHSWQTHQSWWKRNGSFVEAAEFGFSYNLITLNGEIYSTPAQQPAASVSFQSLAGSSRFRRYCAGPTHPSRSWSWRTGLSLCSGEIRKTREQATSALCACWLISSKGTPTECT